MTKIAATTDKPQRPRKAKENIVARNAKYEMLGDDTVTSWDGRKLFRIRAVAAILSLRIQAGDLGGYIEAEKCLQVSGDAWVYGNAQVSGNAWVYGDARVYGVNLVATRSDGYTFLVAATPQGARIIAGCRYFTLDEAVEHWTRTRGGTKLGDESLSIVAHLKRMAELNGLIEPVADPEAVLAADQLTTPNRRPEVSA